MLKVLSLGVGVQSSTIALMAKDGVIDKVDCAIFSDTGWEPKGVYEYLEFLKSTLPYPLHIVKKGNLREDTLSLGRSASMPLFTSSGGKLFRQCTQDYKIAPVQTKVREIIGVKRVYGDEIKCHMLIGISLDEIQRAKGSRVKWIKNVFPLLELELTRENCLKWLNDNNYPIPPKSSCIGCPFHDNDHWRNMKKHNPKEFQDAIDFDNKVRVHPKLRDEVFIHRSLKPLENVDLTEKKTNQMNWFIEECDGFCGV